MVGRGGVKGAATARTELCGPPRGRHAPLQHAQKLALEDGAEMSHNHNVVDVLFPNGARACVWRSEKIE